jgi:hypothetical protein
MKKQWLCLTAMFCMACSAFAVDNSQIHALRKFDPNNPPGAPCNGSCNISYNGGPVMETAATVYIVWYGNWTAKDKKVIDYYFTHLGGTTQMKINTVYSDSKNKFVPNAVKHNAATDDYHDNYSLGKSVNDGGIQKIVANAIKNKHLPNDQNGVYFVLTYKDVTDPDGFCSQFCGYHSPSTSIVSGEVIKYSMVGDPGQCPSGCSTPVVVHDTGKGGSPNQDPDADGTTAIMWHEFSESVSDPEVNLQTAWAGSCGENGDCCAWIFGALKKDGNGNFYTNTIGTKHYVMQQMFELNSKTRGQNVPGTCKNVF